MLDEKLKKLTKFMVFRSDEYFIGMNKIKNVLKSIKIQHCKIADKDHEDEFRVFAHVGCKKDTICVSKYIQSLDDCNIYGILAHEIGHIIDLQHEDVARYVLNYNDYNYDGMKGFGDEVMADFMIDALFDLHIYYDEDKIQTLAISPGAINQIF